jgi:hypothetical protein
MNIRATCVDKKCRAYGVEKSVVVGTLLGFGEKDRITCPICGGPMKTTKTSNPSALRSPGRRPTSRSTGRKTAKKRTSRRTYRRSSGRR